jgi:hypothetical protein
MTSSDPTTDLVVDIAVPLIVAAIGGALSYITYRYQKKRTRHAALADAFRMLNDVKHREARKVLYDIGEGKIPRESSYKIIGIDKETNGRSNQKDLEDICSHIVRNDFNEIGTLAHYKLLDGKTFITEDFWIILKVWSLLKYDIEDRRKRHSFNYMRHLEDLQKKACKYAKRHYPKTYEEFCDKATDAK